MQRNFTIILSTAVFIMLITYGSAWALTIIDPFPNATNTIVAGFGGQIQSTKYSISTSWYSENTIYEGMLPVDLAAYGKMPSSYQYTINGITYTGTYAKAITETSPLPATTLYARSIIDTVSGLTSEASLVGPGNAGTSGRLFTQDLPTSASFDISGNAISYSAQVGISVLATPPTGAPLSTTWLNNWYGFMPDSAQGAVMGTVILANNNGNLSWQVERWSWLPPTDYFPVLNAEIIAQGFGIFDFSLLGGYVTNIVNNRTSDYYFEAFDNVYVEANLPFATNDTTGYMIANLNFDAAPVPEPATFLLLGAGLVSLVVYDRKRKQR